MFRKPQSPSASGHDAPPQLLRRILSSLPGGEEPSGEQLRDEARLSPPQESAPHDAGEQAEAQPLVAGKRHLPLPFPWVSRDPRDRGQRVGVSQSPAEEQASSEGSRAAAVGDAAEQPMRSLHFRPRQVTRRPRKVGKVVGKGTLRPS